MSQITNLFQVSAIPGSHPFICRHCRQERRYSVSRSHRLLKLMSITKSHFVIVMKQRSHSDTMLHFSVELAATGSTGAFLLLIAAMALERKRGLRHCNCNVTAE
ncbi:hypothetical protein M758_UG108300 [Ceratodon purpureus]|nr:hypothetical protein M758_UG108300 [Ceratodon purpureus]